jgi:hypothetical protein
VHVRFGSIDNPILEYDQIPYYSGGNSWYKWNFINSISNDMKD